MTQNNYKNAEWLREKYVNEEMSINDIADICNCSYSTIYYWFEKLDINTRKPPQERFLTPYTSTDGYVRVDVTDGDKKYGVVLHRLLAVSEYGVDAVKDAEVHHKNSIRWDNRPENIEVMSKENHAQLHNSGDDPKYRDKSWLREKYVDDGMLQREIAELCGCAPRTISSWLDKHGIDASEHYDLSDNFDQQTIEKVSGGVV